ncbi:MAG TPA: hypothetical protein VGW37_11640 [Terriglobia bacterium]|nr:hypothetical protein [Terriglobia bacterium]
MLTKPVVLRLEGSIPAAEWSKHRAVDRPEVDIPSAISRLHMAGAAGDDLSGLKCFGQIILVDKANLTFTDYDL